MSFDDPDDEEAAVLADREFHLRIVAACGNSSAYHIVDLLWKTHDELPQVKEV